jgi:HEPN domain-containing protein
MRTDLADRLLRRARSHHGAASALSGEADVADFVIGFHAHQAVEQSLVAVLVHSGEPPPRTHALDLIARLLAERDVIAPRQLMACGWLDPWAVQARYEDVEPALDRPRALETAALAVDWAIRLLSPRDARGPSQAARSDMLPLPRSRRCSHASDRSCATSRAIPPKPSTCGASARPSGSSVRTPERTLPGRRGGRPLVIETEPIKGSRLWSAASA